MGKTGLIHVYTGDGKGKTTAAVGLSVRMAGAGKRVLFVQFLKAPESSELSIMQAMGIHMLDSCTSNQFLCNMTEEELALCRQEQERIFLQAASLSDAYDLVVLDEVIGAATTKMIDVSILEEYLNRKPDHTEVVLTGRDAPESILAIADYVSEVKAVKHPYDKGMKARKGIEF